MGEVEVRKSFRGRAVLPGNLEGEARVTRSGFNAYASFYNCLSGKADSAICADSGNPDLYGERLDGMVICLPKTIGSTSAGAVWGRVARLDVAPKAMLFSQQIDSLAAAGLIIADVWAGKRIYTIDQLGDEFLESIQNGDLIVIREDGTVESQ
jgi:predicted aconitase with swiveling domain